MRFKISFIFIMIACLGFAQKTKVQGVIKDVITGEPIVGAIIIYGEGKNTTTDIDGNFSVSVDSGNYVFKASYIGYLPVEKKITAKGKPVFIEFPLSSNELTEVEVVSDIAIQRETPVAFANIDAKKIQEDLGARDLPLILNSTPGVYATSQGGGDGDARVSIRGFNAQNVLVLLDGIPMNDMVNGRVYWSNWFGLDNLTRGVQVQRGLGATKLAIPAIGGTMNILTAGIDSKRAIVLKSEYGNNNNFRLGLSYSSGRLKNGWAFNFAGSYKRNDGWFDHMNSNMWFYYGKIEKKIGGHLIGFQVLGAPQTSAQRDFRVSYNVGAYDKGFAYNLGLDTVSTPTKNRELGWRYNPSWNYLVRRKEGETVPTLYNTSINKFHKPVISVKDFFAVSEKLNISTIAYASYGRGYGTQLDGGSAGNNLVPYTRQQAIQKIYDDNTSVTTNSLATGEQFSSSWIRKNHNDHDWYGALVTANYKVHPNVNLSGGLDGRLYKGYVYSTYGDLLGGDVVKGDGDLNNPNWGVNKQTKKSGDKYVQDLERRVRWAGAFAMAEYKKDKWSGFINASYAITMYKQINYFLPKQLRDGDNVFDIGYNSKAVVYDGKVYTNSSPELVYNQTGWKQLAGYTLKGGANYNINENMNVFANVGYLNRVPFITFVYTSLNVPYQEVNNELIKSAELGYSYSNKNFSANLNGYYTIWDNKPTQANIFSPLTGEQIVTTATGMSARHVGVELDFIYRLSPKISIDGMASIGDWEWISEATAATFNDDGSIYSQQRIDPRGVKVADAAQHTAGLSVRYQPTKRMYFKPQFNYFGKNYANLNLNDYAVTYRDSYVNGNGVTIPETQKANPNLGRQAWRMPDYYLMDFSAGYNFKVNKIKLDARATVINVLNTFYISDAQNNDLNTADYNAASATVNVGMGRRWLVSLTATF